nr:hypothetical protein [Deltaproteobacteria bacterium]
LPMLPRRPQLDAAQLRHTVASGFFSDRPTSTIHRGIDQLRPACVVRVDPRGDHQTLRYWRPPETSELRGLGDEDYDRLLRATLFDAVEGALPRSGDVLSELSGGLDSSSVSAIASIVLGTQTPSRRVHTVSYVDPRPDTDEGSYQRDLCARHDLSNYRLRFDETFALADLVGTQTVGLHTFQSLVAEDRLRRNRLGGHVCLTGHGGDAVLGNILQPNFLADLMMSRQWSRWWRALRSYGGAEGWSLLPLLRMSLDRQVRRGRRVAPHWLRGGETNPPGDPEPVFRLPARAKLYRDIVTLAPHSFDDPRSPIEFRHPLLDRSLVELALRLPWEQLGRPGRGRILQRRVLADVLPPSIRERTDKADFTAAVIHCFRSVVQRHPEVSGAPMLAALGVVEPAPFSRALDRALHGICDDDQSAVFAATTFECWLQANARHRPPSLGALAAWAGPPRGAQASTGAPVNSGS